MPQDTGFDAFFKAVTTSNEFKAAVTKDWKGDAKNALEASISEMKKGTDEASEMMAAFNAQFATPEAVMAGNSYRDANYADVREGPASRQAADTPDSEGGKINVKRFEMKNPETFGFKGIAGMDDLKKELAESFVAPLKFKFLVERLSGESPESADGAPAPEASEADRKKAELYKKLHAEYEKFKVSIPTGLLFYGPPGTGKTYVTKKLAEELGAGFIEKSVGEFGSSYQHQTTKNIREFFAQAKAASEKEPTLLFLDEIDSILSSRTNNIDASKAEEVSQFLQEFNGLSSAKNLVVIAATNRPDHLDSAILRSGRLDKKIYIGPPDETARKEMFRLYIEREGRPHGKLDYDELAKLTEGYVSSDIEAICDEVARDASRNILDLAAAFENGEHDAAAIEKKLSGHSITMDTLKRAIADTPSSLKAVDMSVYGNWLEKTGTEPAVRKIRA